MPFRRRKSFRRFRRKRFSRLRRRSRRFSRINTRRGHPEVKIFTNTTSTSTDIIASDQVILIPITSQITQGTGILARVGLQVTPRLIQLKAQFNAGTSCVIRWVVVQWLADQNENPIATADIWGSPGEVTSMGFYQGRKMIRILKQGMMSMNPSADADTAVRHLNFSIKPRSPVYWTGTASSTASKNHIYFFAFSNIAQAGDNPTGDVTTRVYFSDQ